LDSPELRTQMAARARTKVQARCDWRQIASQYCDMYREASARGRGWEAA